MLRKNKPDVKGIAIGATVAAAAGYVVGILTAPKSGKQTRKGISRTAKKSIKKAEKEYNKLHKELDGLVADVKVKSAQVSDKTSKELTELADKAKAAKEKAGSVIGAIKSGEAEDKELNKAVSEANKALANLKKYLKK
jgi:gas vesicle protein